MRRKREREIEREKSLIKQADEEPEWLCTERLARVWRQQTLRIATSCPRIFAPVPRLIVVCCTQETRADNRNI
jgi:hypothetical protein